MNEQEAADIIEATGADWLPCGCLGTQSEHTCGPRETSDEDEERRAKGLPCAHHCADCAEDGACATCGDPIERLRTYDRDGEPHDEVTRTATGRVVTERDTLRWAAEAEQGHDDERAFERDEATGQPINVAFTLTFTVDYGRWRYAAGVMSGDDPVADFREYIQTAPLAAYLLDGMGMLRDADGTVTVEPTT